MRDRANSAWLLSMRSRWWYRPDLWLGARPPIPSRVWGSDAPRAFRLLLPMWPFLPPVSSASENGADLSILERGIRALAPAAAQVVEIRGAATCRRKASGTPSASGCAGRPSRTSGGSRAGQPSQAVKRHQEVTGRVRAQPAAKPGAIHQGRPCHRRQRPTAVASRSQADRAAERARPRDPPPDRTPLRSGDPAELGASRGCTTCWRRAHARPDDQRRTWLVTKYATPGELRRAGPKRIRAASQARARPAQSGEARSDGPGPGPGAAYGLADGAAERTTAVLIRELAAEALAAARGSRVSTASWRGSSATTLMPPSSAACPEWGRS